MKKFDVSRLLRGEQIVYTTHLHWFILVPVCATAVIGSLFGILFFFIGICIVAKTLIEKLTTEVIITTKRVIIKRGWLYLSLNELCFSQLETLSVNQSLLGKILNYGDVSIIGTGGTKGEIKCLDNPLQLSSILLSR